MDNEMKAKTEEFLKKSGRRELSLDEMDKVVGGDYGIFGNLGLDNLHKYGFAN